MERRRLSITAQSFILYSCLGLFALRDCIRVIGGKFVIGLNGWEFERYTGPIMSIFAIISIILLIIYILAFVRTRLAARLRWVVFFLTLLSIFWTIHSFLTVPGYSLGTLDGTAKTIWICLLGLYLGYDESSWLRVKKIVPFLAVLYMGLTFAYVVYIRFNGMWRQQTKQAPYWMTYSTAIWLLAYLVFCYENKHKIDNYRLLSLLIMNTFIIAFTISRGWMLQTVFMMVLFITSSSSSRKAKRRLIFLLIAILGIGTYVLRDEISLYFASYVSKFLTASSRESQYLSFFSQVPISDLILGKGEYASYTYRNVQNYIYIDNSYLYYAFHFGILYALLILGMEIKEGLSILKVSMNNQDRKIGYILIMWIAALSGASVFCAGYEVSFRVLFAMILVGRAASVTDLQRAIPNVEEGLVK